jgi:hypothetical protein
MEGARERRTRVVTAKLHELLMAHWESYRTRTIRLDPSLLAVKYGGNPTRLAQSRERLHALWELMRMEMPDRKSDVVDGRASLLVAEPSLWKAYRRAAQSIKGNDRTRDDIGWTPTYQHAECLYLIVSNIQIGESNGLDFFTEREIGDKDGDGMKEIWDAWERPIMFLRWAPGLSMGNPDLNIEGQSELQPADPVSSPDPFDPLRLYAGHFALFPLVFSAGPDGEYDYLGDLQTQAFRYKDTASSAWRPTSWQYPYPDLPPNYPFIDPDGDEELLAFGEPVDDGNDRAVNHADNVTNHYLGKQ